MIWLMRLFLFVWLVWVFVYGNTCTKSWSVGWRKVNWTPWDTMVSWSALVMFPAMILVLDHVATM